MVIVLQPNPAWARASRAGADLDWIAPTSATSPLITAPTTTVPKPNLSGIPADILADAEAGTVEMTDEVSEKVQRVYWSLSALKASPADYRRLLAEMAMKANED